jgi:hypothetical protein
MHARFWIIPVLVCLLPVRAAAQEPPAPPALVRAENGPQPQLPPLPQDQVNSFRKLLNLPPGEREQALSNRAPEQKRELLAKLREYSALQPDERELRLRLVQLRMHLKPLMRLAPSQRAPRLALVPEEDRPLIEERLRQWDKIPTELQTEFLQHEGTIHYLLRMESSTPEQRARFLRSFPPEQRQLLDQELVRWHGLPVETRRRMYSSFHEFFQLDAKERGKTLSTLSEAERKQMERSLRAFELLPPEQRKQCIESFQKFASMSSEEREQFLKNAARWEAMTPEERRTWRELVQTLPPMPPLPPGLRQVPPLPPGLTLSPAAKQGTGQP